MKIITGTIRWPDGAELTVRGSFELNCGGGPIEYSGALEHLEVTPADLPSRGYGTTFEHMVESIAKFHGATADFTEEGEWIFTEE